MRIEFQYVIEIVTRFTNNRIGLQCRNRLTNQIKATELWSKDFSGGQLYFIFILFNFARITLNIKNRYIYNSRARKLPEIAQGF